MGSQSQKALILAFICGLRKMVKRRGSLFYWVEPRRGAIFFRPIRYHVRNHFPSHLVFRAIKLTPIR
jgi:hypothetical protein